MTEAELDALVDDLRSGAALRRVRGGVLRSDDLNNMDAAADAITALRRELAEKSQAEIENDRLREMVKSAWRVGSELLRERDAAVRELAEAKADGERLDWMLTANRWEIRYWTGEFWDHVATRKEIDAARAAKGDE